MRWLLIFGLLCLANIGLLIESRDSVVSQEIRHEELAQTYRASLESGNLLTKYAGTGYDDTQSKPVGKFEAAGWTDDLGLYVVTSAVGIVGIDNLSINSIWIAPMELGLRQSHIFRNVTCHHRPCAYLRSLCNILVTLFR